MAYFKESIKLPFSHFGRMSLGALFSMIPGINVITGFFTTGYLLGIMREPNQVELPEWRDYGQLFLKGLYGFLISLIYFAPALIVALLVFGRSLFTNGQLVSSIGEWGVLLVLLLFGITAYFVPVGLLEFAHTYSLRLSIQVLRLYKDALNKHYLAQWLLAFLVYVVINTLLVLLAFPLNFLGLIGTALIIILAGYGSFISACASFALFGHIRDLTGSSTSESFQTTVRSSSGNAAVNGNKRTRAINKRATGKAKSNAASRTVSTSKKRRK